MPGWKKKIFGELNPDEPLDAERIKYFEKLEKAEGKVGAIRKIIDIARTAKP